MMAGKPIRQSIKDARFEWKGDHGHMDPSPQLGVALGLKFIRDHLKENELSYTVSWDAKHKAFLIVGHMPGSEPLGTALLFGDRELLAVRSPEELADTFEIRVVNAVNSLELALLGKIEATPYGTNKPIS